MLIQAWPKDVIKDAIHPGTRQEGVSNQEKIRCMAKWGGTELRDTAMSLWRRKLQDFRGSHRMSDIGPSAMIDFKAGFVWNAGRSAVETLESAKDRLYGAEGL